MIGWSWQEIQLHLEDEQRSGTGVFEEMAETKVGFQIGDTVKVTAEDFEGQEGELQAIEPLAFVGEFFGVYLESTQNIQWFAADEIEKVR